MSAGVRPATTPAPRPRRRVAAWAVALAAGLAGGLVAFLSLPEPRARLAVGASIEAPVERRLAHALAGAGRVEVWDVAFSPDGALLASAGTDGVVRLWEVATGAAVASLVHPAAVTAVVFSADGRSIFTACEDGKVRSFLLERPGEAREMIGQGGPVRALAASRDGALVAGGGADGTVRIWRADGTLRTRLRPDPRSVDAVAFSPDGTLLATGGADRKVRLLRVGNGEIVRTLDRHGQAVASLAFSPDGALLLAGGDDAALRTYQVVDGHGVDVLRGGPEDLCAVAASPDGRLWATGGRVRGGLAAAWARVAGRWPEPGAPSVRLWRASDGALVAALTGHADDVHAVAFSPDGRHLATGGADGAVLLRGLAPSPGAAP